MDMFVFLHALESVSLHMLSQRCTLSMQTTHAWPACHRFCILNMCLITNKEAIVSLKIVIVIAKADFNMLPLLHELTCWTNCLSLSVVELQDCRSQPFMPNAFKNCIRTQRKTPLTQVCDTNKMCLCHSTQHQLCGESELRDGESHVRKREALSETEVSCSEASGRYEADVPVSSLWDPTVKALSVCLL